MPENTATERPNRRAENKARTRQKVLEAAKRLFMQRGYEGATMRDIAADAGLSTGALFANFTDKADLFNEVILTDFETQHERITKALAGAETVKAKIMAMMSSGYEFHLSQLPLLQAGISVSWSHGLNGELGERPVWKTVTNYLVEILEEGARKGELAQRLRPRPAGRHHLGHLPRQLPPRGVRRLGPGPAQGAPRAAGRPSAVGRPQVK